MSAQDIKKQVEFYFSDSNYRKDTFLKAAAESDPDGFVAISVLLTFNRLKSLSTDIDKIAEAIADSTSVVLSADKKKVKRAAPLPEVDESASRSLYVKGFPTDDKTVTIDSITEQFSAYGKVLYVKMRQVKDKSTNAMTFKGSVVIEFDSEATMKAALAAAKGADGQILIGWKDKKFAEVCAFNDWLNDKKAYSKKSHSENKAESAAEKKRKLEEDDETEEETPKGEEVKYDPNLVVSISNLPTHLTGVELKEFLRTFADARYVDYVNGETAACIRCADADAATKLVGSLASPVTFPKSEESVQVEAKVLSGEEEKAFWVKSDADFKARAEARHKKGGRGGGRGGRGGRGGKRQRV